MRELWFTERHWSPSPSSGTEHSVVAAPRRAAIFTELPSSPLINWQYMEHHARKRNTVLMGNSTGGDCKQDFITSEANFDENGDGRF